MPYPTTWNLSRYFYSGLDDPKFIADIANIMPATQAFAKKYELTLPTFTTAKEIYEFYQEYEKLSDALIEPSYYLFYLSSLDTQDTEVQKKSGEVDYVYIEASNLLLFISQAWKTIGIERIMEWSRDPLLAGIKNDLVSTADNIRYILSEKEEYVLNMKSRPMGLANGLHDELTGSYEFKMHIHGEEKTLTEEEVRSYRQHTDRSIRKEAYASIRKVYNTKQNQITL